MQHPDEGTIHAWLDGALPEGEGAALETHVASCSGCQAVVAEARGLIAASSRIVSALDIVPAGVIPARVQPGRAWHASPQFRAAAAILFVAGASMLVMRGRGSGPLADTAERVMSQAIQDSASAKAQDGAMAEPRATAPPRNTAGAEARPRVAAEAPARESTKNEAAETFTGAGMKQQSTESDAVAASSMAAAGAAAGSTAELAERLTVISADSMDHTRITRYRLASGEEITLNETQPAAPAARRAESARAMAAPAPPPLASAPARMDSAAVTPVATISWTDQKTGRQHTLSGRVSRERLEQLRKAIESTRR